MNLRGIKYGNMLGMYSKYALLKTKVFETINCYFLSDEDGSFFIRLTVSIC